MPRIFAFIWMFILSGLVAFAIPNESAVRGLSRSCDTQQIYWMALDNAVISQTNVGYDGASKVGCGYDKPAVLTANEDGIHLVGGPAIIAAFAKFLAQEGGLRAAAMDAHNALANPIAIQNSAVAVVEADVSGIGTTYYASGSGAYLSPAQRASLIASGVPEENIFSGAAFASANQLENHAEQVILRNIPEDATINGWGISWTTDQRPIPCPNCAPFVQNAGGIIQGR